MSWQGYETLYKGVGDKRLRRVLVVVTSLADLSRYCGGTVLLLTRRAIRVDLVVVAPGEGDAEGLCGSLGVSDLTTLGHRRLRIPGARELRGELVEQIRRLRPEVVVSADPTPLLRQHPDDRLVARAALDAAWPYAAEPDEHSQAGAPHQPKEAWLFGGPAPDLFVPLDQALRAELARLDCPPTGSEEKFAQVDLRPGAETGTAADTNRG